MKNIFIVWDFEKNGKFWSMAEKQSRNNNIVCLVKEKDNAKSMFICTTWKQAEKIADMHNEAYISDGRFAL